jgi:hypothetical protein
MVGVETRNRAEQHDWSFQVPESAVSVSAKGVGRIHLGSTRSGGYAEVSLKAVPHGPSVASTCQGRTATRTRHISLTGTVLLHTRSSGKHAWGTVGTAHRTLRFSTRSTVILQKPAASKCQDDTSSFPCRNTRFWEASGGVPPELDFFTSANKGAHAEIAGFRSVPLPRPSGATRTDIVSLPQPSANQLVAVPGSATMQARFRGGTVTMSSTQPAIKQTGRCGKGKKTITVRYWDSDLTNGAQPIVVPARIFGDFSTTDTTMGVFGRVTLKH